MPIVTGEEAGLVHCFGALERRQANSYTPASNLTRRFVGELKTGSPRRQTAQQRPFIVGSTKRMELLVEFLLQQWVLVIALIASLVMLFLHESRKTGPSVSPQQAISLVNSDNGIFLDVRDGADFKKGHIADAVHIPLAQLPSRREELAKFKDNPIIVVCKMGQSAGPATRQLREAGFERAQKMSGGMMEWTALKLPILSK